MRGRKISPPSGTTALAYFSFLHPGGGYNGRISENLKLTRYNCTFAFDPVTTPSIRGTNEYSSSHSSGLGYFPPRLPPSATSVAAWPTPPPWPSSRPSHNRSPSGSPARRPTAAESKRLRCRPPHMESPTPRNQVAGRNNFRAATRFFQSSCVPCLSIPAFAGHRSDIARCKGRQGAVGLGVVCRVMVFNFWHNWASFFCVRVFSFSVSATRLGPRGRRRWYAGFCSQ